MKLKPWLSTCDGKNSGDTISGTSPGLIHSPPTKSLISDTSSGFTDNQSSSASNSSIQTNFSLITLPSVPSLQKLTLSQETASVTAVAVASLRLRRADRVNFLEIHNNLLYAAAGNEIHVYEILHNTLFDTFKTVNSGSVKSIAFVNGKIFTAHQDCQIRVWIVTEEKHHKLLATLPTLGDRLRRSILPQNYVRVRRHKKRLWVQHHDVVSGLATCQGENHVTSISWDKSIKIWRAGNSQCLESINRAHDDAINAIAISKDGIVYTGSADRRIKVWKKDGKKHRLLSTLEKHKSAVNALALNLDDSVLFSGSCDRSILVWEREDSADHMAVIGALRGHDRAILCLIHAQHLLLSGSGDRTVRIWRRGVHGRYGCLAVLDGHHSPVRSLAAVAEDTADDGGAVVMKVFSGSFDGEIKVWEVKQLVSSMGLLL